MKEDWQKIPDFENYEVSNLGSVRRNKKNDIYPKLLTPWKVNNRKVIRLTTGKKQINRYIYQLVMMAFAGPRPNGFVVAHLNGNSLDDRLENLKYCTQKENISHMKAHGTLQNGEKHHASVFKKWQILAMRYLARKGISQRKIAILFDTQPSNVNIIVRNKGWKI